MVPKYSLYQQDQNMNKISEQKDLIRHSDTRDDIIVQHKYGVDNHFNEIKSNKSSNSQI